VLQTEYAIADMTLSGREERPDRPRGIVLALHGGGYSAGYWDYPAHSLLRLAAERALLAVAVDRPGYGAAFAHPMPLARQADVVLDLIDALIAREGPLPVLVTGHSMGGILALIAAANPRAEALLSAIDVSGVPLRYPAAMQQALSARVLPDGETHFPPNAPDHCRTLFFGPDGTFDPDALAFAEELARPVPGAELPDAANAPRDLPAVMRHIRLPVRMTFAQDEASSIATPDIAAAARADLAASRRADVRFEPATGHNISLHHAASPFHRGMLDWFDTILEGK